MKKVTLSSKEPIAIIGMSCRFPQAKDLAAFWNLLVDNKSAITEIPQERWDIEPYYDADLTAANKTNQRHGGLLSDIHHFDPLFFNISPAEATEMSPSQKLMLELTWEAIENSGMPFKRALGSKAGVYVGNIWNDFEHYRKHKNATVTSHSAVGQSSNIIANRVSFSFGFSGPSLVVDTGCSSSLVALHIACQALWDGSIEMAVTGGVNHIVDPDQNILLSKFGGLSSKGKCSTFDSDADGFVRSEGAGILLMKTLSKAKEDGDHIYALIRGSAMNNNGYNVNLPATSVNGQKQVLHDAYLESGIKPGDVHYVEAHGTGTKLGDPTETKALGEFFGTEREKNLHVGSVKTNIGHLEAAAGIAGLLKVVLAINNKLLPSNLNFKTPNPAISFDTLKLKVQAGNTTWPAQEGETLKAGVNSFGWGGTNAHTVLEEYINGEQKTSPFKKHLRYALPLSAKSPAALQAYVKAYGELFTNLSEEEIERACVATAINKPSFDYRMMLSATSKEEFVNALSLATEDALHAVPQKLRGEKNKLVMVFPGQGSQWLGMGQELFVKEPIFKASIEQSDKAFQPFVDWSLVEQLNATSETSRLNEINVIQPMLFAVQVALAHLWMSWGVRPDAVVGHSMGEVAAAHIAGAVSLDEAAAIICTRSLLMRTVSGKGGAMVVTELSLSDAEKLVAQFPKLSVAVSNSPKSTVLAGDQASVTEVIALLEKQELFCRQVKVDVASHSQQMDPLKELLRDALQSVKPQATTTPLFSTVRMKFMEGEEMNKDYWVDNLRGTVQFSYAMQQLMENDHTIFIEVSPHPVLTNAIQECAQAQKADLVISPSLLRDKPEHSTLYKNLGDLYAAGLDIPWETFYETTRAPHITLPSYPFQRERYEIEDHSAETKSNRINTKHPLLGNAITLAGTEQTYFWESQLSLDQFPYLKDHQVNDTIVVPGVTYVEMILEAAAELYHHGAPVISNLKFLKAIQLEKDPVSVQLKITCGDDRGDVFQFFQKTSTSSGKIKWVLLAEGTLATKPKHQVQANKTPVETEAAEILTGLEYYQQLRALGLQYGEYFQGIEQIVKTKEPLNEVHFTIKADERLAKSKAQYKLHPAILDSLVQPVFYDVVARIEGETTRTTLLSEIEEITFAQDWNFTGLLKGVAIVYPCKEDLQRGLLHAEADIFIYNEEDQLILKIKSAKAKIIDSTLIEKQRDKLNKWLYKINWSKKSHTLTEDEAQVKHEKSWVIFGDPYGISEILIDKMLHAGMHTILVSPGENYSKINAHQYTINYALEANYEMVMNDIFSGRTGKIEGIIHAASISYNWSDPPLTADSVEAQQVFGSISFMYLHQRLSALKLFEIPRLVIVSNGIQTVGIEKDIAQPVHSPLWGMAKVMFNELTQYNCRYLDLSSNPSQEEFEQLIRHLTHPLDFENEIALRGKDSYVPRLAVHHQEEYDYTEKKKQFSADGTYLVTGFRGLGFHFIEWMIKQGARHFALISRSGEAPEDVVDKIAKYTAQGCRFNIFRADTGNYEELKSVLNLIEECMPSLKGVVHAAGVIEAKTLTDLDQEGFLRILNPKVKGAWNLHLLTMNKALDCFIMFSSASTLIGLSGQGSYVAANAFLDTLAQSRKSMGLPGMSINWGVIKDVGMVSNEADLEKYARAEGFEPVAMRDAMEVFHAIYDSEHTQIGIVKLHAESMATYYSSLAKTQYFKGLLKSEDNQQAPEKKFAVMYRELHSDEDRLIALEELVMQHVATIVKTSVARINSAMTFKGLGIDSLMAIQLRNLLEKSLNLKLSVAMFWSHPSISEYADYLLARVQDNATLPAESPIKKEIQWFVRQTPNAEAEARLFLFHDAGGDSSLFSSVTQALSKVFDIVSVELPGRGHRMQESAYTNVHTLIEDLIPPLTPLLDKPYFVFGHSMGGMMAFELTRALEEKNLKLPVKLFVSSTPGLTTYSKREVDHTLTDGELYEMFPYLNPKLHDDKEWHKLLMKILRADLQLLSNYQYEKKSPLSVPIVALYGKHDERVRREQAERWSDETSQEFRLIERPGEHRYIANDTHFISLMLIDEFNLVEVPAKSIH
jgi:acyl transferase domain-containing protein/surfactin synthase thioesterase subunit/NADP-dependent 3-hydroxy acid dehydrogenase YdfG/acyl carrier protein